MVYAFCLALLLAPLARGTALRSILFALIAMAIAWAQMAITQNAGGSVHHTILLWPLPEFVIAVSFAAASRRLGRAGIPALAGALAVIGFSCLLVTNEYYVMMSRNGGSTSWTDAIFPLNDTLKRVPAQYVFCTDWGYLDGLRLLSGGKLPLREGTAPLSDAAQTRIMLALPGAVFVSHSDAMEMFKGNNRKLADAAAAAGYQREVLARVNDGYGRLAFEISRFSQQAQNAAEPHQR
jgi:hypothetical protein